MCNENKESIMLRLPESESKTLVDMKKYMDEKVSTKAIVRALNSYVSDKKQIEELERTINRLEMELRENKGITDNFTESLIDLFKHKGIELVS